MLAVLRGQTVPFDASESLCYSLRMPTTPNRHTAGTQGGVGGRFKEGARAAEVVSDTPITLAPQPSLTSVVRPPTPESRPQEVIVRPKNRKEMRYTVAMAMPDHKAVPRDELRRRVRDNMALKRLKGSTRRHVDQAIDWNLAQSKLHEDRNGGLRLGSMNSSYLGGLKSSYIVDEFKDQRTQRTESDEMQTDSHLPDSLETWEKRVSSGLDVRPTYGFTPPQI